ncbi:hypothetical protein VPHD81_0075 [Vibrio phage D81]
MINKVNSWGFYFPHAVPLYYPHTRFTPIFDGLSIVLLSLL